MSVGKLLLCSVLISFSTLAPLAYGAEWADRVRECVREGRLNEALAVTEARKASHPLDLEARAWHARVLHWLGRNGEAEAELVEVLKEQQADGELYVELARVLAERGQRSRALEVLERCVSAVDSSGPCRLERARLLAAAGDRKAAVSAYRSLLEGASAGDLRQAARAELREQRRHQVILDLERGPVGHAVAAGVLTRWTEQWRTAATLGWCSRFGSSAANAQAAVTRAFRRWGAFTIDGSVGTKSEIAPRAHVAAGFDRGFRRRETGFLRAIEATYQQRWTWYREIRVVNTGPGIILYLPNGWTSSFGIEAVTVDSQNARSHRHASGRARVGFPAGRKCSGYAFFATGTENFGTIERALYRVTRHAGVGMTVPVGGHEITIRVASFQIPGGRRFWSSGVGYAARF